MSLYPQKWHLPEGELHDGDFHRVRSGELVNGRYYYVHVEIPGGKGKSKSKTASLSVEYDIVGQLQEDDELDPAMRNTPMYVIKAIYKRGKGKKWVANEDVEYFMSAGIDAEEESVHKSFFYVQTPPRHIPGVSSTLPPSPGTYHYNWLAHMNAQRKGESTLRYTSKQANRKIVSKSKSKTRRNRK
jgi:hypothetical protein